MLQAIDDEAQELPHEEEWEIWQWVSCSWRCQFSTEGCTILDYVTYVPMHAEENSQGTKEENRNHLLYKFMWHCETISLYERIEEE